MLEKMDLFFENRLSDYDEELGFEKYDAAVSVESLHHFAGERKLSLYRKLLYSLKSDGC